jgi:hypothetical protein
VNRIRIADKVVGWVGLFAIPSPAAIRDGCRFPSTIPADIAERATDGWFRGVAQGMLHHEMVTDGSRNM